MTQSLPGTRPIVSPRSLTMRRRSAPRDAAWGLTTSRVRYMAVTGLTQARTARRPCAASGSIGQGHQPHAGLFVLRVEVQPVRVFALVDDHGDSLLELLLRDGGGGDFVDLVCLHVLRPARIALLDPSACIGRTAQQADELVVIEVDDLGTRHKSTLSLRVPRKYLKVAGNASKRRANRATCRIPGAAPRFRHQSPSGPARQPDPHAHHPEDYPDHEPCPRRGPNLAVPHRLHAPKDEEDDRQAAEDVVSGHAQTTVTSSETSPY